MAEDKIGAVRRLLQDLLAPEISRVDERVLSLSKECIRLSDDIKENGQEIRDLWKEVQRCNEGIARLEGRIENLTEEIVTKVQLAIERADKSRSGPRRKLPKRPD